MRGGDPGHRLSQRQRERGRMENYEKRGPENRGRG